MRLETFFEKFELFAEAPGAVAKMRELVLELAVRGNLVRQIPAEGDGEALLNQIRMKNPESDIDAEPVDLDLPIIPGSWALSRLGEVAEIIRGVTFPGSAKSKERSGRVVACLRTASVQAEIDWDDLIFISPVHVSRTDQWVAPNDIMISMANSYALVGKVAIVRQVPQKATFGAFLAAIRPVLIEPYFLLYVLRSPRMQAAFRASSSQTTNIANISLGRMRPIPFPLPPLAEQKRIVAKVDELMALCDRLEAQQQGRQTRHTALARASLSRFAEAPTPANLDFLFHDAYAIDPADLRKSILTLAVQGKLVPQDPNDVEPEEALLEIQQKRLRRAKAGELRTAKVPAGAFLEEPLPLIPYSWRTVSFDHVAVIHNNALKAGPFGSALKKEFYVATGYKIYGQEQVIAGDPFIGNYYIDDKKFAELESCAVSTGDILISLVGTIGKILVLPEGIEPGVINPRVIKLSLDQQLVYPLFVKVLIGSPYAVDFFEENSHGGTMNILNLSILRSLPLPLPPLAEQHRIVAKVDQLMALVDQLEAQLAASRTAAANLLESVVAELTSVV